MYPKPDMIIKVKLPHTQITVIRHMPFQLVISRKRFNGLSSSFAK